MALRRVSASSALMSRSGPKAPQTVAPMPALSIRLRIAAVSMVDGSSTQTSIRSKPSSAILSTRSSVALEKGEAQMKVLAPNFMTPPSDQLAFEALDDLDRLLRVLIVELASATVTQRAEGVGRGGQQLEGDMTFVAHILQRLHDRQEVGVALPGCGAV